MRSRPRKRVVAALAVVGAMALSGCTVHPGSAVVIDDQSISQSHIDDLVLAACAFTKVNRIGNTPSTSMAYLRNVLLDNEINFAISHRLVTALHLTVSPAKVAIASAGQKIPSALSSKDRDLLRQFFVDSARSQLEEAVIGAHLKDHTVTNADSVTGANVSELVKAAQPLITAYTKRQDVVVNPAYGSWDGATLVDSEGSLSAPASAPAKKWILLRKTNSNSVAGLPPSQVCG